jgi:hypothetical protein
LVFDARLVGSIDILGLKDPLAVLATKVGMAALCAVTNNFAAFAIFAQNNLICH